MAELMCLDLTDKKLVTRSVNLRVGYSNSLKIPPASGTISLGTETNLDKIIIPTISTLYKNIVNPDFPIRRINITLNNLTKEGYQQLSLFDDPNVFEKNKKVQNTLVKIKDKFGKNSVLKGMNLEKGATTIERPIRIPTTSLFSCSAKAESSSPTPAAASNPPASASASTIPTSCTATTCPATSTMTASCSTAANRRCP